MPAATPQGEVAQDGNKLHGSQPGATCLAMRCRTNQRFSQRDPANDYVQEAAQGRAEEECHKEESGVHSFINRPRLTQNCFQGKSAAAENMGDGCRTVRPNSASTVPASAGSTADPTRKTGISFPSGTSR